MRGFLLFASIVLIVGLSPIVTWWLVGDLSEDVYAPDYFLKPPELTETTENIIGAAASIVVGSSVALLLLTSWRQLHTRRYISAMIPLLALGIFVGFSYRVITAGAAGANIGAGLLVMFSVVFVPVMLFVSYWLYHYSPDAYQWNKKPE